VVRYRPCGVATHVPLRPPRGPRWRTAFHGSQSRDVGRPAVSVGRVLAQRLMQLVPAVMPRRLSWRRAYPGSSRRRALAEGVPQSRGIGRARSPGTTGARRRTDHGSGRGRTVFRSHRADPVGGPRHRALRDLAGCVYPACASSTSRQLSRRDAPIYSRPPLGTQHAGWVNREGNAYPDGKPRSPRASTCSTPSSGRGRRRRGRSPGWKSRRRRQVHDEKADVVLGATGKQSSKQLVAERFGITERGWL
jgi:hypothetical protein